MIRCWAKMVNNLTLMYYASTTMFTIDTDATRHDGDKTS